MWKKKIQHIFKENKTKQNNNLNNFRGRVLFCFVLMGNIGIKKSLTRWHFSKRESKGKYLV